MGVLNYDLCARDTIFKLVLRVCEDCNYSQTVAVSITLGKRTKKGTRIVENVLTGLIRLLMNDTNS